MTTGGILLTNDRFELIELIHECSIAANHQPDRFYYGECPIRTTFPFRTILSGPEQPIPFEIVRGPKFPIPVHLARLLFLHLGNKSAMKKYQLGEFEEIVLLTIGILYKEAYGVSIKKEIEKRLSRTVSMGAMHTALVRLEDKGYIRSRDGESTEERMGRPRKYFEITALGKKAMVYAKETRDELWQAIPKVVFELKGQA